MSLMEALAKVAIDLAANKGANSATDTGMLGQGRAARPAPGGQAGGLEDMLGQILGGNPSDQSGGLGDLLESLGGGGGLDAALGQGSAGGGGSILDELMSGLGAPAPQAPQKSASSDKSGKNSQKNQRSRSFGRELNSALAGGRAPEPDPGHEAMAALMLSAMIQAAKSDGEFDRAEQAKIVEKLGDVSAAERDFVNRELQKPMDVDGLVRQTPRGLESQVYAMSVLGIDLDKQAEAQYLHGLASGLNLQPAAVNAIHDQLGARRIYG